MHLDAVLGNLVCETGPAIHVSQKCVCFAFCRRFEDDSFANQSRIQEKGQSKKAK